MATLSTADAQTMAPAAQAPDVAAVDDPTRALLERALTASPTGITADEVVEKALQHSPALSRAKLSATQAEANAARAKLLLVPRFDLKGSYTRLSPIDLPPEIQAIFRPLFDQYAAVASVRVPLTDLFLTLLPTYQGIQSSSEIARAERDARALNVALDARLQFYGYVRARGALIVNEDSVRVLEAHVQDLKALVTAGAATPTDLARAEAFAAQAKVAVLQARGRVEVSLEALARTVGAPLAPDRPLGEALVDEAASPPEDAADVLEGALSQRPELRALTAVRRMREREASAKRGGRYPVLSAGANLYYANPNPRIIPPDPTFRTTWDVGLTLSFSPNDFLQNHFQADAAEADLEMIAEDQRALENGIALEVVSAVVDTRTAHERIGAAELSVRASQRHYEDRRALMLAGAATPSDVLEAEQELRRSQLEWVDAHVQSKMAKAALLKARGEVLHRERAGVRRESP
jgi:outer membrane protein TolC